MHHLRFLSLALAAPCCALSAPAHPLRDLSTDRPDTTESPYSVDKGHFQIETELVAFTRDGGEWEEFTLGETNAKFGLTDKSDIQVVIPFMIHEEGVGEGLGDIEIRLKHNLWGNDSGETAMALMPYLKLPTASEDFGNGEVEGGLIVPFSFAAAGDWSCGLMAEIGVAHDDDGGGYHLTGLVSATASHGITENTAGFLEIAGMVSAGSTEESEVYFNTGITWAVTETLQMDGGLRIGLTNASADLTPFAGISRKF